MPSTRDGEISPSGRTRSTRLLIGGRSDTPADRPLPPVLEGISVSVKGNASEGPDGRPVHADRRAAGGERDLAARAGPAVGRAGPDRVDRAGAGVLRLLDVRQRPQGSPQEALGGAGRMPGDQPELG